MGACISYKRPPVSIALLGTANAGKSTFLKTLRVLYTGGFTDEEVLHWKDIIQNYVLSAFRELAGICSSEIAKLDARDYSHHIHVLKGNGFIGNEVKEAILALLPILQNHFHNPNYQHLYENVDYFASKLDIIFEEDYIPTTDDILRARQRTVGYNNHVTIDFKDKELSFIDCGGQERERLKWPDIAAKAVACLYLTSLSSFDVYENEQPFVLLEGTETSKVPTEQDIDKEKRQTVMMESLKVWTELVNSQWFARCGLILLLNKMDIFKEKVKKGGFSTVFHNFKGEETPERCSKYIEKKFKARLPPERGMYCHVTCAVDTKMVSDIFNDVCTHVCQAALTKTGIL